MQEGEPEVPHSGEGVGLGREYHDECGADNREHAAQLPEQV